MEKALTWLDINKMYVGIKSELRPKEKVTTSMIKKSIEKDEDYLFMLKNAKYEIYRHDLVGRMFGIYIIPPKRQLKLTPQRARFDAKGLRVGQLGVNEIVFLFPASMFNEIADLAGMRKRRVTNANQTR